MEENFGIEWKKIASVECEKNMTMLCPVVLFSWFAQIVS